MQIMNRRNPKRNMRSPMKTMRKRRHRPKILSKNRKNQSRKRWIRASNAGPWHSPGRGNAPLHKNEQILSEKEGTDA